MEDGTKERSGAVQVSDSVALPTELKATIWDKLKSTNFLIAAFMVVFGLFVGFPKEQGERLIVLAVEFIAGAQLLRTYFVNAKLDVKAWLLNANTYASIGTLLATFFTLPPGFLQAIQDTIGSIINKDPRGIFVGGSYLITIAINLFRKK